MVRFPSFAGSFYPQNNLDKIIQDYFDNCINKNIDQEKIKALISPHAGYIYSGIVAACGFKLLQNIYKNIILLGPSHQAMVTEPYGDENDLWETPLGQIKINKNLYSRLKIPLSKEVHENEHSIEGQLPFLQTILKNFEICPIALNYYNENLTESIIKNLSDDLLIVASSDLSHYLPYHIAKDRDKKTIDAILNLDEDKFEEAGDACGKAGIQTLIKIAKKMNWKPTLIDYKNSGDTAGDKDAVVGYASIAFIK